MRFTAWRFNLPRPPPAKIPPPPAPPPPPGPQSPPAPRVPPPPGPPPPAPPRPPPGPCPPGPPSPAGLLGTNPFGPNPPGPLPARPWPTVPCNKNESEVALEPPPAGNSAAICVPSFAGVVVAAAARPAPSSVQSVCSKPPPARPARRRGLRGQLLQSRDAQNDWNGTGRHQRNLHDERRVRESQLAGFHAI